MLLSSAAMIGTTALTLDWTLPTAVSAVSAQPELVPRGAAHAGPYFYLPKMQSHKEARLWNDVFIEAQDLLNIPRGTIKVCSRNKIYQLQQLVCSLCGCHSNLTVATS